MIHIESRAPLVETPVGHRLDARAHAIVGVTVVQNFRERVEGIEHQPVRVQLPELRCRRVISRVAHIRQKVDAAELRVGQIVLSERERSLLKRRIALSERRGKRVDVPRLRQAHARRPLVEHLQKALRVHLVFHRRVPVHDITRMQIRIEPRRVPRAIIRAYIRRRAVRQHIVDDRRRTLAQPEQHRRIPRRALLHVQSLVFVELLQRVLPPQIHRVDTEPAPQHPFVPHMPRRPDPRLEIPKVAAVQPARRMNDCPHPSRERVHRRRAELALQSVRRLKRTLRRPAQPQIEGHLA